MTYEIDKDIPIPPLKRRHNNYPFTEMDVGDSFLVPHDTNLKVSTLRNVVSQAKKKLGFNFAVSEVEDGVRIWRIDDK